MNVSCNGLKSEMIKMKKGKTNETKLGDKKRREIGKDR